MSFTQRVASFAAASLCLLGLSIATAGRAAEPIATPEMATASTAAHLLSATLTTMSGTPILAPTLPVPALPDTDTTTAPQPAPHFASLEAAVAAQSSGQGVESASDDVACLAGAIYFEAKGEPLSGQLAVANVIINRAKSGRFPSDVCGVVTQRGQFSFVRGGHVPAIDAAAHGYRTAVALARVALAEAWDSPAADALFFHARRVGMGRGTQVAAIGNHIFYR